MGLLSQTSYGQWIALPVKKTKHILVTGKKGHTMHFHISIHNLIFFTSMWLEFETITANHKFSKEIMLPGKVWFTKIVFKGNTDTERK